MGWVVPLEGERQGQCHEEVQQGAFCSPLVDPAARLQEGAAARCSADSVVAAGDVFGGELVEGEAQAFPHCLQEKPGGVREGSIDVEGGDHEVHRVHVGNAVLKEDGLVWGPAWDSLQEAGRYVGVHAGEDAAQEDGPVDLYLSDCTHYRAPVGRVGPDPLFVEGADTAGPVWWYRGLYRDDVPQEFGEEVDEAGGEVVLCLRREAVVARELVTPETVDGLPDFVDGEAALLQLPPLGVVEDLGEAFGFALGVCV